MRGGEGGIVPPDRRKRSPDYFHATIYMYTYIYIGLVYGTVYAYERMTWTNQARMRLETFK